MECQLTAISAATACFATSDPKQAVTIVKNTLQHFVNEQYAQIGEVAVKTAMEISTKPETTSQAVVKAILLVINEQQNCLNVKKDEYTGLRETVSKEKLSVPNPQPITPPKYISALPSYLRATNPTVCQLPNPMESTLSFNKELYHNHLTHNLPQSSSHPTHLTTEVKVNPVQGDHHDGHPRRAQTEPITGHLDRATTKTQIEVETQVIEQEEDQTQTQRHLHHVSPIPVKTKVRLQAPLIQEQRYEQPAPPIPSVPMPVPSVPSKTTMPPVPVRTFTPIRSRAPTIATSVPTRRPTPARPIGISARSATNFQTEIKSPKNKAQVASSVTASSTIESSDLATESSATKRSATESSATQSVRQQHPPQYQHLHQLEFNTSSQKVPPSSVQHTTIEEERPVPPTPQFLEKPRPRSRSAGIYHPLSRVPYSETVVPPPPLHYRRRIKPTPLTVV